MTLDEGRFGGALRALRRDRRMSLSEVSAATGISASFLSLVENDKSDITISRLMRLAAFYEVHVSDLLPTIGRDPMVVRSNEQQHISSPSEGIELYLLGPPAPHRMLPLIVVFDAGGHLAEWASHDGEEYVYVLEGRVRLELEGREPVVLEVGDGAYYRADRPHWFEAIDGPARVFGVASPPHL